MSRQVDVKALVSHVVRGDGVNRCRICMGDTTEGQVHLNDTVIMDGEKPVTLSELLETVTGIQMELDMDGDLPDGVCPECSKCAINAAEFRSLCHHAMSQWELTIQLLQNLPGQCDDKVNTVFAIIDNSQMIIINDDMSEDSFDINSAAQRLTAHVNPQRNVIKRDNSSLCKCPNCGKQFQYGHQLSHHLKESTDLKRACHICAKIMLRNDLVSHMIEVHKKSPYDCKKCPAVLYSHNQYTRHLIKAHTRGACTCIECGRSFQSWNAYHAHVSVHRPKACPSCDKMFRNQTCYVHHVKDCCNLDKNRDDIHHTKNKVTVDVKNEHSNKNIKVGLRGSTTKECICDHCGKKFAGKKFVAAHIQIVHMKNTHRPCVYCGKYLAAAHMTQHVKKHESDPSYTCQHCSIVLKTRLGYIQHLRLHTGERPYACGLCGETFSASSRRSEHIRKVHKSSDIVLKQVCHLCPARFRLPYRLKKHLKAVHNDEGDGSLAKFECKECGEKFSSCRGLLHHSRKHQHVPLPDSPVIFKVYSEPNRSIEELPQEEYLFPKGFCITCTSHAVSSFEFKAFVRKSETLWSNCIESLQTVPTLTSSHKSVYAVVRNNLLIHTVNNFEGGAKDLLDHLTNRYAARKILIERKPRHPRHPRAGPACSCTDCGKIFLSPYYLNMHLRNSGQKEACWLCGAMVIRGREMRDHMSKNHKTDMFLCPECPMLFKSELERKRHIKKCHGPGALTCADCGRTFQRHGSFEVHSQMHAVRTCRACGAQFANRGCYREHRSKCEPNAKPDLKTVPRSKRSNIRDPATFTCDYCNKTYHSRPQLKNHILWIHMDIRPHQCQWCGKRFYTPARLAEHSVVHTRVRNFECDICGAKLVSKMAAVYHRRRHTGERPYECPDCGEKFISSSRRSEHAKRRHNRGLRLQCTECQASFVRSHELKKHMDKVHNPDNQLVKIKNDKFLPIVKTEKALI